MNRELSRKLPAQVVHVQGVSRLPRRARWYFATRVDLDSMVTSSARAGLIGRTYRLGQDGRGWWAEVVLLAEPPRRRKWSRRAMVGSIAIVLASAAALVIYVVISSWPIVLTVSAFVAIATGLSWSRGSTRVEVVQSVKVSSR